MKQFKYYFKWENVESQKIFQTLIGFPSGSVTNREIHDILRCCPLSKGARILDIGCGIGRHTIALSNYGYNVTGIDIADHYLEQARSYATKQKVAASFRKQRVSNLGDVNRYDMILAYDHTLGLMPKAELHRHFGKVWLALKNGGWLFFKYAGPWRFPKLKDSNFWNKTGNYYVMTQRKFRGDIRYENTIIIDNNSSKIFEFVERHRVFGRDDIKQMLKHAGFWIVPRRAYVDKIKTIANIDTAFICRK